MRAILRSLWTLGGVALMSSTALGQPAAARAPAIPAPPAVAVRLSVEDLHARCKREVRAITLLANAATDLRERSRLLASRPDCATGMRAPVVDAVRIEARSYGDQVAAADGLSTVTVVLGAAAGSGPIVVVGLSGYLLGGPGVHLSHDRPGAAMGSLILRAAAPVVGGAVGCGFNSGNGELGCVGGFGVGMLVGMAGSMVIDWAWISKERVAVPARATGLHLGLAPRGDGGFAVGVGGWF